MENSIKFKKLLEFFISYLDYKENEDKNFVGYQEYIKPIIENEGQLKKGYGYKGQHIQSYINKWEDYNGNQICLTASDFSAGGFKSNANYLNWVDTSININAKWDENKIIGLTQNYIVPKDNQENFKISNIKKLYPFVSNEDLGLFDGLPPNEKLKEFFNFFYNQLRIRSDERASMSTYNLDKYITLLTKHHNIIFHGAPGTGKTFMAKKIAEKMGAETAFVQFHPSYDYSDFVEGLRPTTGNSFERQDGVFKAFCERAAKNLATSKKSAQEVKQEESTAAKIEEFVNDAIDSHKEFTIVTGNKFFIIDSNEKNIRISIPANEKTDELLLPRSDLEALLNSDAKIENGNDIREFFNRKWRTQQDSYVLILYKAIKSTKVKNETQFPVQKIEKKNFLFVIDEINRGEISKIFGELFFSVEPSYRGKKGLVKTQYQNLVEGGEFAEGFYVPENVYIIGTMNDIDRSVEPMDFAMQRRFKFVEITAEESAENMGLSDETKEIMNRLNNAIVSEDCGLSSDYKIGGSYFLALDSNDPEKHETPEELWNYSLKGLLTEYLKGTGDEDLKFKSLKRAFFEKVDDETVRKVSDSLINENMTAYTEFAK